MELYSSIYTCSKYQLLLDPKYTCLVTQFLKKALCLLSKLTFYILSNEFFTECNFLAQFIIRFVPSVLFTLTIQ